MTWDNISVEKMLRSAFTDILLYLQLVFDDDDDDEEV